MAAVGCYTLRGRCVCVFGVKCGDSCGSEDAVEQVADWHSDAGRKYRRSKDESNARVCVINFFAGWLSNWWCWDGW